ncbi:hypothetical protein HNQ60_000495 [Povalibacter uvarum]|uniref:Glycosyltransferase RgtA/B/C/D-like domain-containing protein n=1 Tax=Povalibacter uvarum TaxID=732238 RepID=A0A841HGU1_9GAMM|nr:hypothetical protein [Povalibacter uvarum]MBB6091649.1 hypothetical protein [Povalibacter uvarum]
MSSTATRSEWQRWMLVLTPIAIVVVGLALAYRPQYLSVDVAQYVDTARNVIEGRGYSTTLIYYEEQMTSGVSPAPQTVWPPVFPLMIALLLAMGVPTLYAPFIVAVLSHAASCVALYVLMRRLRVVPAIAIGATLAWTVAVLPNVLVLRGLSESTYALFTLLTLLVLAPHDRELSRRDCFLAGVFAIATFLVRYAGIAVVGGLGVVMAARWVARPRWSTFWDAVVAMAVPVLIMAATFIRNLMLAGTLSGGPSVEYGSTGMEVARSLIWSTLQTLGFYGSTGGFLVLLLLAVASWFTWEFLAARKGRVHTTELSGANYVPLAVAASSIVFSVALLALLGYQRTPAMINSRYMLPLLPLVIAIVAYVFSGILSARPDEPVRRMRTLSAAGVILVGFLAVQVHAGVYWSDWFRRESQLGAVMAALNQRYEDRSVRDWLLEHSSGDDALLSDGGQLLGLLIDRTTIGLADREWTTRTWTEAEVHSLAQRFKVKFVLFFPESFDPTAESNEHRVFFRELAAGTRPDWLALEVDTPLLKIYQARD